MGIISCQTKKAKIHMLMSPSARELEMRILRVQETLATSYTHTSSQNIMTEVRFLAVKLVQLLVGTFDPTDILWLYSSVLFVYCSCDPKQALRPKMRMTTRIGRKRLDGTNKRNNLLMKEMEIPDDMDHAGISDKMPSNPIPQYEILGAADDKKG
ncbi:hypothetical protein LSAT2_017719 [Lamellibrachia satsuma]|nr:hypothetical protein LSAT2_017719 [Lamellibrachia satsuma]